MIGFPSEPTAIELAAPASAVLTPSSTTVDVNEVQERVWSALTARYNLDDATDEQLDRMRKVLVFPTYAAAAAQASA